MCVIAVSAKGARLPSKDELCRMFVHNPDGAGYMYARNGKVTIHKGFTCFSDLWRSIQSEHFTRQDTVIFHCRIATKGQAIPENTHPFPFSADPTDHKHLDLICRCGIAHNGTIPLTRNIKSNYTDTTEFITRYLVKIVQSSEDIHDPAILDVIDCLTFSKLAFLFGDGSIETVGNFTDINGLLVSNTYYLYDTITNGNYTTSSKKHDWMYEPYTDFTSDYVFSNKGAY